MSVQITRLATSLIAASATAYYTVATDTRTRIDAMTLTNTDTSTRTVSVYLVASGGSPGASNIILSNTSIAPSATLRVKEAFGQVLHSGGKIYAAASVASVVNIYASGVEVT